MGVHTSEADVIRGCVAKKASVVSQGAKAELPSHDLALRVPSISARHLMLKSY